MEGLWVALGLLSIPGLMFLSIWLESRHEKHNRVTVFCAWCGTKYGEAPAWSSFATQPDGSNLCGPCEIERRRQLNVELAAVRAEKATSYAKILTEPEVLEVEVETLRKAGTEL